MTDTDKKKDGPDSAYYNIPMKPAAESVPEVSYQEISTAKNNSYSGINAWDINTADKYSPPPAKPTSTGHDKNKTESKCILVTLIIVVLAVITCFIAVFVEIATLKSKSDVSAQTEIPALNEEFLFNESVPITPYLQQLNDSLEDIKEAIAIYQETSSQEVQIVSQELSALRNSLHQQNVLTNRSISSLKERVTEQALQLNNTLLEQNLLTERSLQQLNGSISNLDQRVTQHISQLTDTPDNLNRLLEQSLQQLNSSLSNLEERVSEHHIQLLNLPANLSQPLQNMPTVTNLQQFNRSISSLKERVTELQLLQSNHSTALYHLTEINTLNLQQLNHSVLRNTEQVLQLNDTTGLSLQWLSHSVTHLDERSTEQVLQLNVSIDYLHWLFEQNLQQLSHNIASLDTKTRENALQLNDSMDDLDQLFEQSMLNLQHLGYDVSSLDERVAQINDSTDSLQQQLEQNTVLLTFFTGQVSIVSCATLPPSFPSGYYWVASVRVRVYCDMTRSCGGVTGGWMRVAELDMTNSSHQCPSGLTQRNDANIITCVKSINSAGCSSVTYSTANINYSRVCGRIIGYQIGTTDAFRSFHLDSGLGITAAYVDGVSLTHGDPRHHIWTFAAALDKNGGFVSAINYCPCQTTPPRDLPPFVGTDYFCDAGNEQYMDGEFGFQTDPLWDGAGCPCCAHPPWFYKQLPQPTTDNIEMRVCRDEDNANEDIAIQVVDIYVR